MKKLLFATMLACVAMVASVMLSACGGSKNAEGTDSATVAKP